jgi:hypothetical protein
MKALKGITILVATLLPFGSLAEEPTVTEGDREEKSSQGENSAAAEEESDGLAAQMKRINERMEKLENENKIQKQKLEEFENAAQAAKEEELEEFDSAVEEYDVDSLFSVYGFFDLTFYKGFTDPKNSIVDAYLPNKSTFLINNINLYFHSKMTHSLEALLELRFSFLPHGLTEDYEVVGKLGDTEFRSTAEGSDCEPSDTVVCSGRNLTKYERVDNTVLNPVTREYYVLGGVNVERVHLTYSPVDWFKIIAGRYLTPYGIWNIDHGSPELIPVRIPYMQANRMVPLSQTGLQVFGRFFPATTVFFDYAVTLSNGRGPIEQVLDLDENKGVGLRLHLTYKKKQFKIEAGGYGYYGKYTDSKKVVVTETVPYYGSPGEYESPVSARVPVTESYKEYVGTADFLLEVYGVKLQAEYIFRYVNFIEPGALQIDDRLTGQGDIFNDLYQADFHGNGVFALLAWELPLSAWLGEVKLTPYFMYEHGDPEDTRPVKTNDFFQLGLNVKPSSFVTLKAEYTYVKPDEKATIKNSQYIFAQMAVAF